MNKIILFGKTQKFIFIKKSVVKINTLFTYLSFKCLLTKNNFQEMNSFCTMHLALGIWFTNLKNCKVNSSLIVEFYLQRLLTDT